MSETYVQMLLSGYGTSHTWDMLPFLPICRNFPLKMSAQHPNEAKEKKGHVTLKFFRFLTFRLKMSNKMDPRTTIWHFLR